MNFEPGQLPPAVHVEAAHFLTQYDSGILAAAAFSARAAYVLMCLTVCWGVLNATGWTHKMSGHQAVRSTHMLLATATIVTAFAHAAIFQLLHDRIITVQQEIVPFADGKWRHAAAIISFELMLVVFVTGGMHRAFRYLSWLRLHQSSYVAVILGAVHSWVGAYFNGHLAIVWLAGITVSVPTLACIILRVAPTRWLVAAGIVERAAPDPLRIDRSRMVEVSVDNQRCHRYAFCQAEAPDLFQLREDGRLQYREHPSPDQQHSVRSAARACPMRAIQLTEVA
jgi:sulfoxide reductase heme-binding subunit YedZ